MDAANLRMTIETVRATGVDEASRVAARLLAREIAVDLAARGTCVLGIVGGRSEPGLLSALVPLVRDLKGELHVLWLDERVQGEKNCATELPLLLAMRSTTLHVFAHPLKTTTRADIIKEADRALATLERVRGSRRFDIVVASAGEDGHVASLFPRHIALKAPGLGYVIVDDAPKAPPVRISATPALIASARWGLLLFEGGEKRVAYTHFLDTSVPTKECPAKILLELPALVVVTALGR